MDIAGKVDTDRVAVKVRGSVAHPEALVQYTIIYKWLSFHSYLCEVPPSVNCLYCLPASRLLCASVDTLTTLRHCPHLLLPQTLLRCLPSFYRHQYGVHIMEVQGGRRRAAHRGDRVCRDLCLRG